MHIAITGGTGLVGSRILAAALAAGHMVTLLSRRPPEAAGPAVRHLRWELGEGMDLSGVDALVHAAFSHVPGRYRGGEGADPRGFVRANRDGSMLLFDAARRAGVGAVLHLSSRAVLDGYAPGTLLTEDLAPRPTSLYGEVKAQLEAALISAASPRFQGVSLRATGVYGLPPPGQPHKWSKLLADMAAGRPIPRRVATEVHADDLAGAVLLLLDAASRRSGALRAPPDDRQAAPPVPPVAHASDIILDHRDLALAVSRLLGRSDIPLPERSDAGRLSVLDCTALRRLGWQPGGWVSLQRTLAALLPPAAIPVIGEGDEGREGSTTGPAVS